VLQFGVDRLDGMGMMEAGHRHADAGWPCVFRQSDEDTIDPHSSEESSKNDSQPEKTDVVGFQCRSTRGSADGHQTPALPVLLPDETGSQSKEWAKVVATMLMPVRSETFGLFHPLAALALQCAERSLHFP
jgi:hypothetical protein